MPKSRPPRRKRQPSRHKPHHLDVDLQITPKFDPNDPRAALRARTARWTSVANDYGNCDHTPPRACPECITALAETHWIRVRPNPNTPWLTLNGAPGYEHMSAAFTPDGPPIDSSAT